MKLFVISLALLAASMQAQQVLTCDFSKESLTNWSLPKGATVKSDDRGPYLEITLDKPTGGEGRAVLPFDFTKYVGKAVKLQAEFSYDNVSKPRDSWNGTKFMLIFQTKDGKTHWMHPSGSYGSSPWKPISYFANIPDDVQPGTIELGLQDSSGTVRFRNLVVSVIDPVHIFPKFTDDDYICEYTDRLKNEPRRRGVMSTGSFHPGVISSDLPDLQKWGANLYRWQLIRNWGSHNDSQDVDEYLNWVKGKIPGTKQVLDKAQELGIKVVLDLHVPPGGRRSDGCMNMFEDKKFADAFKEAWRILATAVKGHPALYGYDLINEPNQPRDIVPFGYLQLQFDTAKIVREIDPDTPIIIESNGWDAPGEFAHLRPIPLKDVIYQAHMYFPFEFTHQGVHNNPVGGHRFYPNPDRPNEYSKEALKKHLQPVRDFQLRHKARIYIGEFSAIRWAEGAHNYLKDCIDIFEEYGWDWSYHAFREWSGWSVEHSDDRNDNGPAKSDTLRKKVLLQGFQNNLK